MSVCAHKRCRRKATEAFDVFSWWAPRDEQADTHYEVCAKHAAMFVGTFARQASEKVQQECVPWRPPANVPRAIEEELGA